jgi:CubicO group peptidase (beta-lactamase class C family)
MTVRDLLTHRSGLGLGAGDLLTWPSTTFTRTEIVERLRYVKPATSFRSGYAYDNVLYIVAGRLVEVVSGMAWEQFVQERILTPLGMRETTASFKAVKVANRGWPHARRDGAACGMGSVEPLGAVPDIDNAAPAGAINSSASDMTRWLLLQLDRGVTGGTRVFSETQAREMWTPHTLIPIDPAPTELAATTPSFKTYALGWEVRDYRGHRIVTHEGAVAGGLSATFLIPERRVGFIVMINSEDGEARRALSYRLLDHYLSLPPTDWIAAYAEVRKRNLDSALQVLQSAPGVADEHVAGPSLPIEKYAAVYRDAWYGTVTISVAGDGLQIRFDRTPAMVGRLEHVRYDTFRTRFGNKCVEDAYVTFSLKPDGQIEHAKLEAISPLADFSFDYHDLLLTPVSVE